MSGITPSLLKKWKFERPVQGLKVTSIGRHHYHVSSETRPEINHVVDTGEDMPHCSCEDFTINKSILCKHIRRVGLLAEAHLLPKQPQKDKR